MLCLYIYDLINYNNINSPDLLFHIGFCVPFYSIRNYSFFALPNSKTDIAANTFFPRVTLSLVNNIFIHVDI